MIKTGETEAKSKPLSKSEQRRRSILDDGSSRPETPESGKLRKFLVPGHGIVEAETLEEAVSKITNK